MIEPSDATLSVLAEALGGFGEVITSPPSEARVQPIPALHPALTERLASNGISALYSHQAAAYEAIKSGKDVAIVSGTNSGKTLCYNLPAFEIALAEPAARALYMFPTKALAQDQLGKLEALCPSSSIRIATYDGDTPTSQRSAIRKVASFVLTNPDMLHVGILPSHELWTKFLRSLRLIVVDEMHVYRGVFGSHTANVLKRLLRLCEWHGSKPQIVACSATIGNPLELFRKLTGRDATLIDSDGAPKSQRTYVFFNPPHVDETERMSSNVVSAQMLATLAEHGLRSLAFCRARITTELVLQYARRYVEREGTVKPAQIEAYRAGYTAKERRQIEQRLFKGDLLSLAATNALELGVDIGGLDAVIMNGYPGSISAFRQQAGRAGRGSRPGLAIYVAQDEPLEQFLVREPHRILESSPETVAIHPENPHILTRHLVCAAHERPLAPSELSRFGDSAIEVAEGLEMAGSLQLRNGLFFHPAHDSPAKHVNIRGSSGEEVRMLVNDELLGTMERWRAIQYAHVGAIYLHRGAPFEVQELDLNLSIARLAPVRPDYYTQPIVQSSIEPVLTLGEAPWGTERASLVSARVTDIVSAYKKKSVDGGKILGVFDLDMPTLNFDTFSVRLDLVGKMHPEPGRAIGGIHGVEHALLAVAPMFAGCDRDDLGSTWYGVCADTFRPGIYVFDRTPGGVGLAEALFADLPAWGSAARQLLASCPCVQGCPSCLLSPRCEAGNESLDKEVALELLANLMRAP